MSLKPKKKSDLKKIEEKMKVKASKMESMQHLPPYTMIVSEGIKTEKIYIYNLEKIKELKESKKACIKCSHENEK